MTTNRELLDVLGRDTLVRLMRERDLPPTRENDERRKALAHSYRGDVEALILDLSRQELVQLFEELSFVVGGIECCLSGPNRYRHRELEAFAIYAFAGRRVRIPSSFTPVDLDEGEEDEVLDDEGIDAGGENHVDDEDVDNESEEDIDDVTSDDDIDDEEEVSVAEALRIENGRWSRPRMLQRILADLGYEPVQRLRTVRFRDLIAELADGGVEACLADDPTEQVLTVHDGSPGIDSKLRLRLASGVQRHDVRAARRAPTQRVESSRSRAADGGPRIVIQEGEAPIRAQVVKLSPYAVADARLRFLTSVLTGRRRSLPAWPDEYLLAATRGQALSAAECSRLRAFSASLCFGSEDLDDTIQRLRHSLSLAEWSTLLDDFKQLNPFHSELVEAIVQQVEATLGPRALAASRSLVEPVAIDPARAQLPAPEIGLHTKSSRKPTSSAPSKDPQAANHRDLGALSGMFDGD